MVIASQIHQTDTNDPANQTASPLSCGCEKRELRIRIAATKTRS